MSAVQTQNGIHNMVPIQLSFNHPKEEGNYERNRDH